MWLRNPEFNRPVPTTGADYSYEGIFTAVRFCILRGGGGWKHHSNKRDRQIDLLNHIMVLADKCCF